jgi:hypothetical protein
MANGWIKATNILITGINLISPFKDIPKLGSVSFGKIGAESTAGAALSFARSEVKTPDSLKKNLISSVQLSFYLGQNFGEYFLDSLAGFSWNAFGVLNEFFDFLSS